MAGGLFQLLGMGARSLSAAQLAQATVGNNAANAATPGYSRRRTSLVEAPAVQLGNMVFGTGVRTADLVRLRDALIDVQRRADSQEFQYSKTQHGVLEQVESLFGPADDAGLATTLNGLFTAFGDLATRPEDLATRQALLGQGQAFADAARQTRDRLGRLLGDTFASIGHRVDEVNATASRLAALNAERVAGVSDPALADEQDRLVDRLAELIGARATHRADGTVQVVIEGTGIQLVDAARAATVAVSGMPSIGTASLTVDGLALAQTRGEIGGLLAMRNSATDGLPKIIADLDALVAGVVTAVNRVHASGAGRNLAQSTTGSVVVGNPAVPLNTQGLVPPPVAGTLQLGVFTAAGAFVSTGSVAVNPAVMSLNDLATAIDALPDISASVSGGRLVVNATNAANRIAFGSDTSDSLVSLGVNGFFTGTTAATVAVSGSLTADPYLIAAAQADFTAGVVSPGDARNAQALAALATATVLGGGTQTASDFLGAVGAAIGTTTRNASARADTQGALLQAAEAQRQATSGVNLDEELADMVRYQHAYEASSHYIRTVDQMIQTLLGIMR
jgi:flagellar hook-associated protein 1 FlgK